MAMNDPEARPTSDPGPGPGPADPAPAAEGGASGGPPPGSASAATAEAEAEAGARPPGTSPGRAVAWLALAIAVAMIGWPFLRAELPPPSDLPPAEVELGYPEWSGRVVSAADIRGRPGPAIVVDEWITDAPALGDRVVVIDFWATWCGPCIASIPHLNELAESFGEQAAFVAVTNEPRPQFEEGFTRIEAATGGFAPAVGVALDPVGRMMRSVGVRGIPHALVMSRDGIVRWQGSPRDLDAGTLAAIIEADARAATAG